MTKTRLFSLVLAGVLSGVAVAALGFYLYLTQSGEVRFTNPDDIVRMKEIHNPSRPDEVTFVEVNFTGQPNVPQEPTAIRVYYSRIAQYSFNNQSQYKNIRDLVNAYINGYPLNWHTPNYNSDNKANRLSLKSREGRYIVFILKCANCRFARKDVPFRVESNKDEYHFNPRVVWTKNSDILHEEVPDSNADAKIGYFIARSERDYAAHGQFRTGFNFYLELTNQTEAVPVSVDPDVGYPGGNS